SEATLARNLLQDTPEQALPFIRTLAVRKFFGVGQVTEQRMLELGIKTGADLQGYSREELIRLFGKPGNFFYDIVRGIDNRPVQPRQGRKSIGTETTLEKDIQDQKTMLTILAWQAQQVSTSLAAKEMAARTLTLKIRYQNFHTITRSVTRTAGFVDAEDINQQVPDLLAATDAGKKRVRLLGLTVSKLCSRAELEQERNKPVMEQLVLPFDKALG
ncbi:MAG: DNA polymerase IV, partial [Candidatus Electrothrix sp. AR5]|nr:DNA polymerase IV [Candidatus Electrothrix sp. AR5]